MTKVLKSELNLSDITAALENDITDTNNLITALQAFQNAAELKGKAYDAAKKKVGEYISILETRKVTANKIRTAITKGANYLSNFMGEYSYLDDSKLDSLRQILQNAQSNYNNLYNIIYSRNIDTMYTDDELTTNRRQLSYYQRTIVEARKKIKKLEDLPRADGEAFSFLQLGEIANNDYKGKVGGINKSNIQISV